MQSVPFWVGVFVVTALVGVCCSMGDSQPEQEVAHNTHKKKNKNKKKKSPESTTPEPTPVKEEPPKKKGKQA